MLTRLWATLQFFYFFPRYFSHSTGKGHRYESRQCDLRMTCPGLGWGSKGRSASSIIKVFGPYESNAVTTSRLSAGAIAHVRANTTPQVLWRQVYHRILGQTLSFGGDVLGKTCSPWNPGWGLKTPGPGSEQELSFCPFGRCLLSHIPDIGEQRQTRPRTDGKGRQKQEHEHNTGNTEAGDTETRMSVPEIFIYTCLIATFLQWRR